MRASSEAAENAGRCPLVTGASGFIGVRLCSRAPSLGATASAVSRRSSPDLTSDLRGGFADLTHAAPTVTLMRRVRPDVVAHLPNEVIGDRDRGLIVPMLQPT